MSGALYWKALVDRRSTQLRQVQGHVFEGHVTVKSATVISDRQIALDGQTYVMDTAGLGLQAGQAVNVRLADDARPAAASFVPTEASGGVKGGGSSSSSSVPVATHSPVTVSDTATIDLTLTGQALSADLLVAGLFGSVISKLASWMGIDAKTVSIVSLYTVPAGKSLVVDHVVIRVTAFTAGSKTIQAVTSFGGNSATYDDYLNSVTYTVAAVNVAIRSSVESTAVPVYAAGTTFELSIETGSNATTETWSCDLFGYLV